MDTFKAKNLDTLVECLILATLEKSDRLITSNS